VFEAVMMLAMPQVDRGVLLGTIIIYRLIYYIAPLCIAMLLLALHELGEHRHALFRSTDRARRWLSGTAPLLVSAAIFMAGFLLLMSGSTPALEERINFIAKAIPLPVMELSHLAGSIFGVGLLILARGLYRRMRTASFAAMGLLAAAALASLLKGFDYEEAIILCVILAFLWFSRSEFYRRGSPVAQGFTTAWLAAIVLVLGVVLWVGFLSFRHVEYSDALWWQFALHADAPRMLRASLLAAVTVLAFALWALLHIGSPSARTPNDVDLERLRQVVQDADTSSANVALLGDKRILWSADRKAFIMYQISGNSWVAFGDAVGAAASRDELAWTFRELVDRHNGRPVYYEVSGDSLPLYVDMGLTLAKIGEDARVSLPEFSLQGSRRAELRRVTNKIGREGASFAVVRRADVPAILPELRRVSDNWLKVKSAAEKGFSLGFFSEPYIAIFDCGVVRVDGNIVAFANLWPAPLASELSIDLMRYDSRAPKGVMDYLFTELMLWGKDQGYTWFSLGMAPLAGLEQRSLAPLWHKVGHLIFSHGEAFYNFEGLRQYKEKFDPEWRPRYVACPGGLFELPRALLDSSRLISGGLAGLLSV
jgi:phosphatidylglycerol lysyltransferase